MSDQPAIPILDPQDIQGLLSLGVSSTEATALATEAVLVVGAAVESLLGYYLLSREYTDVVVRGNNLHVLPLPARHITAVGAVRVREIGASTYSTVAETQYELDQQADMLRALYGVWDARATYRVTFTAGYQTGALPGDLVEAIAHEVKRYVERRRDVSSSNMGGQSSSGKSYVDISNDTRRVIARHALVSA